MRNSGAKRLRAGFPPSWCIGDKTETSDNGAMGDNCHCVAPDSRSHSYRRLFGRRNPMMHSLRWPGFCRRDSLTLFRLIELHRSFVSFELDSRSRF